MFIDEIAARLVAQGVGTLGVSIFKSSSAQIPALPAPGPFLVLVETGGSGSETTQNDTGRQLPTMSLTSRGTSYQASRAMLKAAYDALGGENGLYNVTLSGVFYLKVKVRQEPTDLGLVDGRAMLAFNVEAEKAPS